jgi:two-component system sensor histidine kinase KdpD
MRRLAATLHLASQLGAPGRVGARAMSVIEGLKRLSTVEARATQLIVGKSMRSRWFELRHGSVVDRLVRETPGIAVHVLPMGAKPAQRRLRSARHRCAGWGTLDRAMRCRWGWSPRW